MTKPTEAALVASAALLLATPALGQERFRLCTGSPGKAYLNVGETLAELAPELTRGAIAIDVAVSEGSIDNIARTLAGECDGFIAQGDALDFYASNIDPQAKEELQIVGELYKELTLLLCRRGSGIGDLDEVGGATVAAGTSGSGSMATLLNLQRLHPDLYGEINVHPENGFAGAMAVLDGEAECVFDVLAPQSDLIRTLNENERTGAQLYFAEIENHELEEYEVDGKRVYDLVTFDDELYGNLSTFGDPEMLAISALLGVSREFLAEHPTAFSELSMVVLMGQQRVHQTAYGDAKPFESD